MKKVINDYVVSLGGTTEYSGSPTRTMYINDKYSSSESVQSIEECIYLKFGFDLPFKLVTNN